MCHHYHHHHSLRCMGVWAHCMCRWTMPACVLWTILRLLRMNSDHFHIFTWRYHVCRAMQEVCTKLFVNFSEAKSTNIYSHTTKYIGQFLTRSINNSKRLTAWGLADDICSIYCNWKKMFTLTEFALSNMNTILNKKVSYHKHRARQHSRSIVLTFFSHSVWSRRTNSFVVSVSLQWLK